MEPVFLSRNVSQGFLEEAAIAASSTHHHDGAGFHDESAPNLNGETALAACGNAHFPEAAPVHQHPAMALYDAVFAMALPAVAALATRKNVPVTADDHPKLLRYALDTMPRKTMKRILAGDPGAAGRIQMAISRALDVFASLRLIHAFAAVEGAEPPDDDVMVARAEALLLRQEPANMGPSIMIWPDLVEHVTAHYALMTAAGDRPALVTLPGSARVRCIMQRVTAAHSADAATGTGASAETPVS